MPLSVLFTHAPSAAFAEGPVLGSTNIAACRIGGVGRAAPPLPLGSGVSPAIFGYFPLLESNQQKPAPGTARTDNRKAMPIKTARRAQRTPEVPPAIFCTFPLLESNKQKPAHATTGTDNRKAILMGPRRRRKRVWSLGQHSGSADPARQGITLTPEGIPAARQKAVPK